MAKDKEIKQLESEHAGLDAASIQRSLANRLEYIIGKDLYTATPRDWFSVAAYVARDRLVERWMETMRTYYREDAKRVYYFSLEFLIGRTLLNSVLNMGIHDEFREALVHVGIDMETLLEQEPDAALGNGGLGRLAACFLDSMATLGIPGYGYGIRYEYGMFTQRIENGHQVEHPENWLRYGNPWEFPRPEVLYPVKFYGRVVDYRDEAGTRRFHWIDTDQVMAMAYDTPIPGFQTNTVNNMRLWAAKATRDFDLKYFNEGNYIKAVEDKSITEGISKVLYPDDTTAEGRELRLKQQYFFISASLQDILYRYRKQHETFDELPNKTATQLNGTHPSLARPELMRTLVDLPRSEWDRAWDLTTRSFAYTNHTLLPEALETWPVRLLERLLPRHLQIIYEVNQRFLNQVVHRYPGDDERIRRMSMIDEGGDRRVRMAHLAVVGSHHVNGVAQLHTELMKSTIFADFHQLYPGKFVNKTNGVTPRRWLYHCNPLLSQLISSKIGDEWPTDLWKLKNIAQWSTDAGFRDEFSAAKRSNKRRLANVIKRELGLNVDMDSMFDVQIKRIHEYKRQLLNLLHVITLYNRIRHNPNIDLVPRTVIFAGKAAPGYRLAKLIIKLINDVADIINYDPVVNDRLKVIFFPNYNVSLAEQIIPAANLSEQISTAGTEASGTGNMKFALNGALTIGTLDGANVEIRQEVGEDNIFIFGMTAKQVMELKSSGYNPWEFYRQNEELRTALDMIRNGYFSPYARELFTPIFEAITNGGDRFCLLADYASYISCQDRVASAYRDPNEWTRKAVLNVAHMGKFSSDRTIDEYAREIWDAKRIHVKFDPETKA